MAAIEQIIKRHILERIEHLEDEQLLDLVYRILTNSKQEYH